MWVCVPGAQYSFEEQTNSFFLSLGQGVFFFEESPKSIQDVIGDVYCLGEFCLNREKWESIGGYVTTPRSIYGCGNCGAWLFVHKVPFTLQEHVKTTKTDKTRFFFAKKMVPDNQFLPNVSFQPTKYRKKELCVDNKVREIIGDVYGRKCRNEKCPYISTKKITSFYYCKKCKACCNDLNVPFMDQKPTIMLFGGDGTHCFPKKTNRDYKKEKPSPFSKKFPRQSQSPAPKKAKLSPNME